MPGTKRVPDELRKGVSECLDNKKVLTSGTKSKTTDTATVATGTINDTDVEDDLYKDENCTYTEKRYALTVMTNNCRRLDRIKGILHPYGIYSEDFLEKVLNERHPNMIYEHYDGSKHKMTFLESENKFSVLKVYEYDENDNPLPYSVDNVIFYPRKFQLVLNGRRKVPVIQVLVNNLKKRNLM